MIHAKPSGNELFPTKNWRYLLPDPFPDSVVALGDGVLPAMARSLGPGPPLDAPGASLGVVDCVDPATLRQVAKLVRPGGAVYLEVPWPRLKPSHQLVRRVLDAGFASPIVYSLSPSDNRWSASWWIPTGNVDAARFVAAAGRTSARPGRSIIDRVRAATSRKLIETPSLVAAHPWLLHPTRRRVLCVIAERPQDRRATSDSTIPGLLPDLPENQTPIWRTTVMRVGGSSTDQAILFGFGDQRSPRIVIKAPTRSEEVAASAHEATMLARLAEEPDPVRGVPRPVPLAAQDRLPAWGQTFVAGDVMATAVDPSNLAAFGHAMTDWLIDLAIRTTIEPKPGHLGRIASDALRSLDLLWACLRDGGALRYRAEQQLRTITDGPLVCQHRDLGPWNAVVEHGSLGVLDWADAIPAGPPLSDLHHFLAHLALCAFDAYGPDRRAPVMADLIDARTTVGRLVDDALWRYATAVGLDHDALRGLRVLTWLMDLGRRPVSEQPSSIYLELLRGELAVT